MGKSYGGDFTFNAAFDVDAAKPIDTRLVVDALTDLTNSISYPYVGLLVYVKGEGKYYAYKETSSNVFEWVELTTSGGTSVSSLDDVPDGSTRKLANYLPLSGGEVYNGSSDTPLYVKGNASGAYIGFKDNSGTSLGYFGVNSSNKPIFYANNSGKEIALKSDIPSVPSTFAGSDSAGGAANNVKGAAAGSVDASRHVWFSDSVTETSRNYDDDFKYNPSSNALYLGGVVLKGTTGIQFQGTKATNIMIKFIDNTNDAYGNGIAIGGGGQTIIGGGESASVAAANLGNSGTKVMYITNDSGNICFVPNTDSGWANRKESYFDANGDLHVNRYLYAQYLNQSSSAETPTSSSYIMYANRDGFLRKSSLANIATYLPAPTSSQKGTIKIVTQSSAPSTYANDTLYLISG